MSESRHVKTRARNQKAGRSELRGVPSTDVAVAIVSFNTRVQLEACLASVMPEAPATVIVADNGSSDGSIELVRSAYPGVTLVANGVNRGYGAAANQAIGASESPYVLLLNSDTRLRPGTLAVLAAHLEDHPAAGLVGPRLLNVDGWPQPSCFPFPTPLHTFLQTTFVGALARWMPRMSARYRPLESPDVPRRVECVLGAALAIRREAFAAVGGFDESFFMYSEEVDLAYRLAAADWEVHYTPLAEVVHVGGASTGQQSVEMEARRYRATRQFYRKHYSRGDQRLLVAMTTYRMLHDLALDSARLAWTRHAAERTRLATRRAVWRRVLRETWRE